MIRPHDLINSRFQFDLLKWLGAGIIRRETYVVLRMKVLSEKDTAPFLIFSKIIDDRDDFIAIGNCKTSAWYEVILDIDNDQCS